MGILLLYPHRCGIDSLELSLSIRPYKYRVRNSPKAWKNHRKVTENFSSKLKRHLYLAKHRLSSTQGQHLVASPHTRAYLPQDYCFFAVTSVTPLLHRPQIHAPRRWNEGKNSLICCHTENDLLSHRESFAVTRRMICCHTEKKWLSHRLFVKIHFIDSYYPEKQHFIINLWQMWQQKT